MDNLPYIVGGMLAGLVVGFAALPTEDQPTPDLSSYDDRAFIEGGAFEDACLPQITLEGVKQCP